MAEGIVEDTVEEFHAHPYIFIGGFVGLAVLIIYLKYRSGSSGAAQNFTFSYGPSDAQVAAGTDLAIAQGQQNTALAIANSNNTAQTTAYGDYFSYLTGQGNNALVSGQQAADVALGESDNNAAVALGAQQTSLVLGQQSADVALGESANAADVALGESANQANVNNGALYVQTVLG